MQRIGFGKKPKRYFILVFEKGNLSLEVSYFSYSHFKKHLRNLGSSAGYGGGNRKQLVLVPVQFGLGQ